MAQTVLVKLTIFESNKLHAYLPADLKETNVGFDRFQ